MGQLWRKKAMVKCNMEWNVWQLYSAEAIEKWAPFVACGSAADLVEWPKKIEEEDDIMIISPALFISHIMVVLTLTFAGSIVEDQTYLLSEGWPEKRRILHQNESNNSNIQPFTWWCYLEKCSVLGPWTRMAMRINWRKKGLAALEPSIAGTFQAPRDEYWRISRSCSHFSSS